jgi:hypothetical protein
MIFTFMTVASAVALAASSYNVTLFDQSTLAGQTLKPGDYKLEVKDNGVVFKRGKQTVEAPATTETSEKKFKTTSIRYNDQHEIQEIVLGGTTTKLVLNHGGAAAKETLR